jgi:hypothetical protein
VFNQLAKIFGLRVDDSEELNDEEVSASLRLNKTTEIRETLINVRQAELDNTHMKYFGGIINTSDIQQFKRLLFRTTKGHAVMNVFDLEVSPEDQLRGDTFHHSKQGFIVLIEDIDMSLLQGSTFMNNRSRLAATTERVCQTFYPGSFIIEPRQVN